MLRAVLRGSAQTTGRGSPRQSRKAVRRCMVIVQVKVTYRYPEFPLLPAQQRRAANSVLAHTGARCPVVPAPMGWDALNHGERTENSLVRDFGSRSLRSTKKQQSGPTNGRRVRGTCHGATHRHRRQRPVQHGAGKSRRQWPMPPCTDQRPHRKKLFVRTSACCSFRRQQPLPSLHDGSSSVHPIFVEARPMKH